MQAVFTLSARMMLHASWHTPRAMLTVAYMHIEQQLILMQQARVPHELLRTDSPQVHRLSVVFAACVIHSEAYLKALCHLCTHVPCLDSSDVQVQIWYACGFSQQIFAGVSREVCYRLHRWKVGHLRKQVWMPN